MAEDLNHAKIYFWGCIKYVHNCHESGELQGFARIRIVIKFICYILILRKTLCNNSPRW